MQSQDLKDNSPSSVLSRKEPERLMARGRSSSELALPPSGWPSPYRSKESWAGMLLERLIPLPLLPLPPAGKLYWLMLVGLTAQENEQTAWSTRRWMISDKYKITEASITYWRKVQTLSWGCGKLEKVPKMCRVEHLILVLAQQQFTLSVT